VLIKTADYNNVPTTSLLFHFEMFPLLYQFAQHVSLSLCLSYCSETLTQGWAIIFAWGQFEKAAFREGPYLMRVEASLDL